MGILAIKGHKTRGKEVIKILEMLGGENVYNKSCSNDSLFCYISDENRICELPISESYRDFVLFTLEEFIEKHPYEVGDEVFITKRNKKAIVDKVVWCRDTVTYWLKYCGFIEGNWTADHLQSYKEETMEEQKQIPPYMDYPVRTEETVEIPEKLKPVIDLSQHSKDEYIIKLGDYEIKEVDGILKAVRKKQKYPKTYEECCWELGYNQIMPKDHILGYMGTLFSAFQQLLICPDAYWKIAGEQMGLGKSWKQDYDNRGFIIANNNGNIHTYEYHGNNNIILAFPT